MIQIGSTAPALPEPEERAPDVIQQWPLRRPVWVGALVATTTLTVATGLLWIGSDVLADFFPENLFARGVAQALAWLAALAVLGWTLRTAERAGAAWLCRLSGGQWRVLATSGRVRLAQAQVLHCWSGPGWLTLRLQGEVDEKPGLRNLDAVVWQRCVTAQAWRDLQKWTLRGVATTAPGQTAA